MSQTMMTLIASVFATAAAAGGDPVFHAPPGDRDWPFSEAVVAGDTLYVSGAIGVDPATGRLVEGGIGPETHQTMTNLKRAIEKHGSSMERVVKCTVFLADIAEWAAMNEVYVTFFPGGKPARSALGASGLALDARVEIECIAML